MLCCEIRSCHARHNDLEGHSNFSSTIYSFFILCLRHHYRGDHQYRSLTKKLNPPSAFVYFRWSWSWYFGLVPGLGLTNLVLFTSLHFTAKFRKRTPNKSGIKPTTYVKCVVTQPSKSWLFTCTASIPKSSANSPSQTTQQACPTTDFWLLSMWKDAFQCRALPRLRAWINPHVKWNVFCGVGKSLVRCPS